jgi:predicted CXXCH cytochrome family protein
MTLEWLTVGLLLAAVFIALGRRLRSVLSWLGLLLIFGLTVGAMAWRQGEIRDKARSRSALEEKTPQQSRSGYASSDTCRSCHPHQYASWHRSYHRTMTQLPSAQSVRGNFESVTLDYAGETYHLERHGDEFWVDMVDPDWKYVEILKQTAQRGGRPAPPAPSASAPRARKRISLLTGSHHMQTYWVPSDHGNMQFGFPFTYVFADQRWLPRNDVFLLDPTIPWIPQVWNVNCINCHATAGQPRQDRQTKVIQSRAAELGIACEACHGPAEEHIRANLNPTRRYALHHAGQGDPTIFNPARRNHLKSSEACGQCHAIRHNDKKDLWNTEGLHFWPGEDIESKAPLVRYDGADLNAPGNEKKRALMEGCFWSDGQARVSGRDFSGMAASGCYQRGEISCLSCHSMHQYQDTDDQLRPRMEGNQACLQCHTAYAAKLEQHTHHRADSSGSLCYNCHMPHTSYGLLKAIRSHTINSPNVKSSLATGRPNACNLCHLDQSLAWTSTNLHNWFRQPIEPLTEEQKNVSAAVTWLLKGDAGQRALIAWHMDWQPARAASGQAWIPRFLAEILVDPYSTVRYIAQRSLKHLPGYADFSYDYIGPVPDRTQARQRALEIWRNQAALMESAAIRSQPAVFLNEDHVSGMLRQRNNRPMELLE